MWHSGSVTRQPGVPDPPDRLYTAGDLFGGWEADRPASAGETFDFLSYAEARAQGLRTPLDREVAAARARHDTAVSWELYEALGGRRVVAIMGGHGMARNSPGYRLVAELAFALAGKDFLLLSGGGPGAMEATHLGARSVGSALGLAEALTMIGADELGAPPEAPPDDRLVFPFRTADELFEGSGGAIPAQVARLHAWQAPAFAVAAATAGDAGTSIGVPTWMYGNEPPTPLATSHAKYFDNSIREDGLLALATAGVVFAPGRAGTLQEIFQDAAQNAYRHKGQPGEDQCCQNPHDHPPPGRPRSDRCHSGRRSAAWRALYSVSSISPRAKRSCRIRSASWCEGRIGGITWSECVRRRTTTVTATTPPQNRTISTAIAIQPPIPQPPPSYPYMVRPPFIRKITRLTIAR